MGPLLQVEDLRAGYGGPPVLHGVSLSVEEGSLVALVGANGAGKTTTLRALTGLIKPAAGRILFAGEDIAGRSPDAIVACGVAHVAEGRRIFRGQSVEANLGIGMYRLRLPRSVKDERIAEVLRIFPSLGEMLTTPASALSGGQQQMVAIAQAIVRHPRLLILDEPSLGLAPRIVDEVFAVVEALRADGTTVVLVEQFVQKALGAADFVYVMQNGRVVADGLPADVTESGALERAYLGGSGNDD